MNIDDVRFLDAELHCIRIYEIPSFTKVGTAKYTESENLG